jgi:hypothetical protein
MKKITVDYWRHVAAGERVENGYGATIKAPAETGLYTLYELADDSNSHIGWKWEKE